METRKQRLIKEIKEDCKKFVLIWFKEKELNKMNIMSLMSIKYLLNNPTKLNSYEITK
tara:strand:- start:814 stop:987 length:174 start_codon:yes stop_codon:yes gene_type:complete